jgi:CubicO group peptidase (beta-lactamase class C family)
MKQIRILVLALLFCGAFLSHAASNEWRQYATPEEAGFDAQALAAAREQADRARSGAVVVVVDGQVLAAWGAIDRKLELYSVRKSLYSALWGIAEERGLVRLETTIGELGVDDLQPLTAAEKKARLIDLLQARSGVYHPSAYSPASMDERLPARGSHAPGTHWFYNNWDFNVAGALLESVTGMPFGTLFEEWIAKPIGMEDYRAVDVRPMREPGVSRWPALTLRMSARDLARFGQLWLNEGRWNGNQIIPAKWIERASAPVSATPMKGEGYGMMWWTYAPGALSADRHPHASRVHAILGRGTGGQVVAVIPALKLVIVHRGDTDQGRPVSDGDVWAIIDKIIGARRDAPAKRPALAALRAESFASQQPAVEIPAAIALDAQTMSALAGDYELRPGVTARIFVHDGRLYGFMPGRGETELFAVAPDELRVHVDPSARIRFDRDDTGAVRAMRVKMGGRELTAQRK